MKKKLIQKLVNVVIKLGLHSQQPVKMYNVTLMCVSVCACVCVCADIRPYKCRFCNYYARTNSQLKVHMMRHQGNCDRVSRCLYQRLEIVVNEQSSW